MSNKHIDFEKEQVEYIKLLKARCVEINFDKALEYAMDCRKFEIDLYWKRATYFWAFIAAIFVTYWGVFNSSNAKVKPIHVLIVTIVGYIFSYSWYLVNRGSKFWQSNWEMHVDFLEDETIGSLYKIVNNPKCYNWYKPFDGLPSSVSKINQMLSLVITLVWVILIFNSLTFIFKSFFIIALVGSSVFIALSIIIYLSTKMSLKAEDTNLSFIYRKSKKNS